MVRWGPYKDGKGNFWCMCIPGIQAALSTPVASAIKDHWHRADDLVMANLRRRGGHAAPQHSSDSPDRLGRTPGHGGGGVDANPRWRPRVRLVLALVVLVPLVSTAVLITSSALGAWRTRQHAELAAQDAAQLRNVASARAEMNSLEVPLTAVSYAEQVGVSEPELDTLLRQATPFRVQLTQVTSQIAAYPTFSSTPTLRADVTELEGLVPRVASDTVSFSTVHAFTNKMAADVDNIWYADYNRLQADISAWQPPGSFEVDAARYGRPIRPSSPEAMRSRPPPMCFKGLDRRMRRKN